MALLNCCPINSNLIKSICGANIGGLSADRVYVANACEVASMTVANYEVTAFTMKVDPITSTPYNFYEFSLVENSGTFNTTIVAEDNGNRYYTYEFSFQNKSFDAQTSALIDQLLGASLIILVQVNGSWIVLGDLNKGMKLGGDSSLASGQAAADFLGVTLSFTNNFIHSPYFVDAGTTIEVSDGAGGTDTITL